ncbi:MAG: O-antigen ligase family protein [Chitinophagales bacterium]
MSPFVFAYSVLLAIAFFKGIDSFLLKNHFTHLLFNRVNEQSKVLIQEKWILIPIALLAFVIPYFRVSTSIPSVLLVLSLLIYLWYAGNWKRVKAFIQVDSSIYFKIISIYLVFIVLHSLLFQGDFIKVQLNFLLLIYFFALIVAKELNKENLIHIAYFYLLGALLFIPLILILAAVNAVDLSWNSFYYTQLLGHVKGNPITHSLYYNIAIILCAKFLSICKNKKEGSIYILMMISFFGMIFLFGSKTGYITAFFSMIFIGFSLITSKALKAVFILGVPFLFYTFYLNVPYIHKKIEGFKWQISRHEKITLENRLPRTVIWSEAVQLIKEEPLRGYGFGKSFEVLKQRYTAINFTKGIRNKFNAHNQFIESSLQLGITGFLWWICLIGYCIYISMMNRDRWLGNFLFVLIAYLLVESLLESQMGIVAIGFFLSYFILSSKKAPI